MKTPKAMPVILKNRPRSMRRLPRTKSTPKMTARTRPASTPRMAIRPPVESDRAERKRTVSIPSRKTMRKVKAKSPAATDAVPSRDTMRESDPFISPERAWEWRHIHTIIEPTITAEPRYRRPSKTSSLTAQR